MVRNANVCDRPAVEWQEVALNAVGEDDAVGRHLRFDPHLLAWFDHGEKPQEAHCAYTICVDTTPEAMDAYATGMKSVEQAPTRILQAGRNVHVVVKGSGPDLVLIHGAGGNARDFTYQFVDLISDRYRVFVVDHRQRRTGRAASAP